jgi:predicted metal-binding membrane protein
MIRRGQPPRVAASALLLGTVGLSWWWTARRMAGMDAFPGASLGTLGWFTVSWVVMMAAMMLPSFAPTLAAYVTATSERRWWRWLAFTCGYLLTWTVVGVVAYGFFWLCGTLLGRHLGWDQGGRWLCGGVIAVAAVYELVPPKQICLARCRDRPRDSPRGAVASGIRSGAWCVGCSAALMASLFALGVMNLRWMALTATLLAVQKAGPWPLAARIATASVLSALAAGLLLSPHLIPGLILPHATPTQAMSGMSG